MTNTKSIVDLRQKILTDSDYIPPLPETVVRVIALLNEGETEPGELEDVLKSDHVLVGRLLAMVNSPFYGLRSKARSIKDAIMVLGYQNLRSLVMVHGAAKFLKRDYSCYGHEPKGLWLHGVSVAAATREIARSLDEDQVIRESLFVAALLHDIGKLLLSEPFAEFSDEQRGQYKDCFAAENALVGITHSEAGGLIVGKWSLEPLVQMVVSHHHDDDCPAEYERHVAMVRLADTLAREQGTGYQQGYKPAVEFKQADFALLGIKEAEWETMREKALEAMESAVSNLGNG